MLSILILGTFALGFNTIAANPYLSMLLVGGYAVVSFAVTVIRLRYGGGHRFKGLSLLSGNNGPALLNLLADIAFVTAVIVLNTHYRLTLVGLLLVLVGVRFLAHISGRNTPLLLLLVLLPPLPTILHHSLAFLKHSSPRLLSAEDLTTQSLIIACCLVIAFAITRKLNPRIAQAAELARALAQSNLSLQESRTRTEQHARLLADEVLRLDLLQDSIRAMNSAIELDDLLQMIVQNAVRVLKAEHSSIGLVDQQTGELVIRCATGVDASELRRRRFAPGVGVAGQVIQHGRPMIVDDVLRDPHYLYANAGPDDAAHHAGGQAAQEPPPATDQGFRRTRSMLCVPLTVEGNVIGTLCVTHSKPHAINRADESLLLTFAEQAALAVHKSQLLEEQKRQSAELKRREEIISTLHSISKSVLGSLDLPQVLSTVISRLSELSRFDSGAIYLLGEQDSELRLESVVGEGIPWPQKADHGMTNTRGNRRDPIPMGELWNRAQRTGMARISTDNLSLLCIPLVNLGKPLGCIVLARKSSEPFSELDEDTVKKLADAATLAIVNARLFSKVSAQQERTTALYRLMLRVNAASNRKQLAQAICQDLYQITRSRAAALLLYDSEQARTSVWATCGEWAHVPAAVSVSLPPGDQFISSMLASLTGAGSSTGSTTPLVIHNAPPEVRQALGSTTCVTIPLAQAGRLYGLLVIEPGAGPPIPPELEETVRLAISHSAMAIERAELFEQSLSSARQSSMLYRVATRVQSSLDMATVIQMTVNSLMEATPVHSCEIYTFEGGNTLLRRRDFAVDQTVEEVDRLLGPEVLVVADEPQVLEALHSQGPVPGGVYATDQGHTLDTHNVLLARLMGSNEPIGLVRITTTLPVEEFVHRHAIFCQTLFTYSGGALERSQLYSTVVRQAEMLQVRARQLTDILHLGNITAADTPLLPLLPQIASGIARSLDCAYVRIGDIGPNSSNSEVWASYREDWSGISGLTTKALSLDTLESLLEAGEPTTGIGNLPVTRGSNRGRAVRSVFLDEGMLSALVPGQPRPLPGVRARRLALVLLESTGGGTLGYILAAFKAHDDPSAKQDEKDAVEVLNIFAQKIALLMENHRIYSQLLDSKRKIEAVVLSISDAVVVTDAELNVLISNTLANDLLGVSSEESYGQSLARFIKHEELLHILRDCIATSRPSSMDVELELRGEIRTYEATVHAIVAPSASNGVSVEGAVLTMRDVTTARATERAKSDFLSMVSHELRTPLNSVQGFLDIILMGKTGELNELQADFLRTARQEASILQRLINDLLDYSQLHSGMLRMEMAPVNLSSLIARVVNHATLRHEGEQLAIVNNVSSDLITMGDELRLEQVFNNLLDNACKFTDAGGRIVISSRRRGNSVTISVKDSGTGIPPSQLNQVFDRFFQGGNTPRRPRRGLGLGLAICKNIVERHGGRIWIESEVGAGTTVFVELALFDPKHAPQAPHALWRTGNHGDGPADMGPDPEQQISSQRPS
jgi:PAS domain S-box-containing protein